MNIGLRLQGYECPATLDKWEEDLNYLYVNDFLRGKGSASELANPLMADLSIAGFSPHDVRISMWVSTTFQSGIWDAVGRIALIITQYHKEWFQRLKQLENEYADQYDGHSKSIPMSVGTEISGRLEDQNLIQGYGMVLNYIKYKKRRYDLKD